MNGIVDLKINFQPTFRESLGYRGILSDSCWQFPISDNMANWNIEWNEKFVGKGGTMALGGGQFGDDKLDPATNFIVSGNFHCLQNLR